MYFACYRLIRARMCPRLRPRCLLDLPVREVREVLAGLAQAHLAETVPGAGGRWRMHDLMRLYARQLSDAHADADGRERARDRLLDYYIAMAGCRRRSSPGAARHDHARRFPGPDECPGLARCRTAQSRGRSGHGRHHGQTKSCRRPTAPHARCLPRLAASIRRLQAIFAVSVGGRAAFGDRHSEAIALGNLGNALINLRRFEEAITALQER